MATTHHGHTCSGMLYQILSSEDYAIALTPGFFRFYALIGVLQALEEKGCLRPSHITGASAGALVGGFLAAGMTPSEMIKSVLAIKRTAIWDVGGSFGLLKGELFQSLVERELPVQTFAECPYKLGVTTFDLGKRKTLYITDGHLATAMRASCTFPGMFQPVMINGSPNIDGGVFDGVGLMALPHALGLAEDCTSCDAYVKEGDKVLGTVEVQEKIDNSSSSSSKRNSTKVNATAGPSTTTTPSSSTTRAPITATGQPALQAATQHLVVNVVFGKASLSSSVLPPELTNHKLLTIIVEGVPMVWPFTMDTMGEVAFKVARAAMLKALHSTHMQELTPLHWCCYVDGHGINLDDYPMPPVTEKAPTIPGPDQRETLRASLLRRSTSEASSADSAHIEHSWTTGARRRGGGKPDHSCSSSAADATHMAAEPTRGNKRKHSDSTGGRLPSAITRDASETYSEYNVSEATSSSDEEEEGARRVSRRAYMDIPSFSFLKGSYRMYPTVVSDALHSMEEAGSALLTDATTVLSSATKSLDQSSKQLYKAVRSTVETVVHDFVSPEGDNETKAAVMDTQEQQEDMAPYTPQRGQRRVTGGVRRQSGSTAPRRRSSVTAATLQTEATSPDTNAATNAGNQRVTRSAVKAQRARSASKRL